MKPIVTTGRAAFIAEAWPRFLRFRPPAMSSPFPPRLPPQQTALFAGAAALSLEMSRRGQNARLNNTCGLTPPPFVAFLRHAHDAARLRAGRSTATSPARVFSFIFPHEGGHACGRRRH